LSKSNTFTTINQLQPSHFIENAYFFKKQKEFPGGRKFPAGAVMGVIPIKNLRRSRKEVHIPDIPVMYSNVIIKPTMKTR